MEEHEVEVENPFTLRSENGVYLGVAVSAAARVEMIKNWNFQLVQDAWRWYLTHPEDKWQAVVVRALRSRERQVIREALRARSRRVLICPNIPGLVDDPDSILGHL